MVRKKVQKCLEDIHLKSNIPGTTTEHNLNLKYPIQQHVAIFITIL